jgi:hypothetical protein
VSDEETPRPIYPHSAWIEHLQSDGEVRRLNKTEVICITEAGIFENLIEQAIPELRESAATLPEGSIERHNADLFIAVAADFAKGMAGDITIAMQAAMRRAQDERSN